MRTHDDKSWDLDATLFSDTHMISHMCKINQNKINKKSGEYSWSTGVS